MVNTVQVQHISTKCPRSSSCTHSVRHNRNTLEITSCWGGEGGDGREGTGGRGGEGGEGGEGGREG